MKGILISLSVAMIVSLMCPAGVLRAADNTQPAIAADSSPDSLPHPLSLEQALALIDDQHPALGRKHLDIVRRRAEGALADTDQHFSIDMEGRLRWFEAGSHVEDAGHDDHRLALVVSRSLYDGGRADAQSLAASAGQQSAQLHYIDSRAQYGLEVIRKFFEIMLADLESARDSEAMAVAFVRMDRGNDNLEMGRISEIEMLALESRYQDTRLKALASDSKARNTRFALALALNRPGEQPSMLIPPVLDINGRELIERETLLQRVMAGNRQLKALDRAIAAAGHKVKAASASYRPRVNARLERAAQKRRLSSADKWRIGVDFSLPLFDGGRGDVATRLARVDLNDLKYQRQLALLNLRQQVQELSEQFRVLSAERERSETFFDYREVYMDRSRALYEMEVKTDLGDAMIEISEAHLRKASQQFRLALTLAQLNALAGEALMDWDALSLVKPEPEEIPQ